MDINISQCPLVALFLKQAQPGQHQRGLHPSPPKGRGGKRVGAENIAGGQGQVDLLQGCVGAAPPIARGLVIKAGNQTGMAQFKALRA